MVLAHQGASEPLRVGATGTKDAMESHIGPHAALVVFVVCAGYVLGDITGGYKPVLYSNMFCCKSRTSLSLTFEYQ